MFKPLSSERQEVFARGKSSIVLMATATLTLAEEPAFTSARVLGSSLPSSFSVANTASISSIDAGSNGACPDTKRMPPKVSLLMVLSFQLLVNIEMAIIYPTALTYSEQLGAGASFSGMMVAVLPFASLLGNYPLQKIMDRVPIKAVLFTESAGSVVANVLYACAGLTHSKYTLLVARLLMGLCSQNIPVYVYISRAVGLKHRSWAGMTLSSVMGAGYVLGPFLAFLTAIFCKELRIDNLVVDQNTLPGWLMAGLWFMHLVLQPFTIEEPCVQSADESKALMSRSEHEERPSVVAITLLLLLQVVGGMTFALWEVFASSFCTRTWGWSDGAAGLYMACVMAALLVVCLIFSVRVAGIFSDRWLLLCCCLGSAIATPLLFDYGLSPNANISMFTVGSFVLLSGCQTFRGCINALCSKVVPDRMQNQMSTWIVMAGNVGRGVGPLAAAHLGVQAFAATNLGVMTVATAGTALAYGQLRPHAKAS